jgi:transposase
MGGERWLSEEAWVAIDPLRPKVYAGTRRVDDRRVISGIIHIVRSGCRRMDCPAVCDPHTTCHRSCNSPRKWALKIP